MTDFSPCLRVIVSHDETVPETWEIPLGPLPPPYPPISGDPLSGEAMDMSPGSPPEDNPTEIDPETEASLADFSVQSADPTSIWIHAFAASPRPFSSDLLHISGQAIHDMLAEAFEVDAESFWISWNSKPIPALTPLSPPSASSLGPPCKSSPEAWAEVRYSCPWTTSFLPPTPSSTFLPHLPALPPGSMLELHIPRDLHPNCLQTGARSSPHFRTGRHLPTTGDSLLLNSHPPVRNPALPIWQWIGAVIQVDGASSQHPSSLGCLGDLPCQDDSRLWIHDAKQITLYWSYELLCTLPPLPYCT